MMIGLNNRDPEISYIKSDIDDFDLPFADESFDIVILHNVIEHLSDPSRVLRESFRVLAHGGILSVVTENQACLRNRLKLLMGMSIYFPLNRWMSQEDRVEKSGRLVFTGHVREYTQQEIKQMLHRSGFVLDVLRLQAAAYPSNQVSEGSSSSACMIDIMSTNRAMLRLYNVVETILPGCRHMICAIASKRTP
jgi:SAM-dependent methyltransferase